MSHTSIGQSARLEYSGRMSVQVALWLAVFGSLCWPVCFSWMYRISSRQDALLNELREQGKRIEKLSRAEHDLIKDVHPTVGEIREDVEEVKDAVPAFSGFWAKSSTAIRHAMPPSYKWPATFLATLLPASSRQTSFRPPLRPCCAMGGYKPPSN